MRFDDSTDRQDRRPRILFVDDEPLVIRSLRRTLTTCDLPWEIHFADTGQAALTHLAQEPFDVIVSDMLMPGMDGAAVLFRVQQEHPAVARIVLTGLPDLDLVFRMVPVAHLSMMKPFDAPALIATIRQALDLRRLLTKPSLRAAIGANPEFAAPPPAFAAIIRAIARDGSALSEVAHVLSDRAALSSRVLRLASYGPSDAARPPVGLLCSLAHSPSSVIAALVFFAEVAEAVDLPSVASAGFSVEAFERHSALTAHLAAQIVGRRAESERAFVAGLLHGIGELVLVKQRPEEVALARARSAEEGVSLEDAKRSVLGVSHAEVGACLLGLFGFPFEVVDAVRRHRQRADVDGNVLDVSRAVYVASVLCRDADATVGYGAAHGLDPDRLGGYASRLDQWRRAARELMQRANP